MDLEDRVGTDFGGFECQVKVFPKGSGESMKASEEGSDRSSAGCGEGALLAAMN